MTECADGTPEETPHDGDDDPDPAAPGLGGSAGGCGRRAAGRAPGRAGPRAGDQPGRPGRAAGAGHQAGAGGRAHRPPGLPPRRPGRPQRGNSRNGTRDKTVITEVGPVEISVPRDRDGTFEPVIVRKRQRRLMGVEDLVVSLVAKGLTTGEVAAHPAEVYGTQVSRQTISTITDRVLEGLAAFKSRPLDAVYPVIFIDAIQVKIRDGAVANRPIYVALGVTCDGERDILGLWAGDGDQGAKYWLHVLTEVKNRGVADVCIVVCDGLTGLPDAISTVWPQAITQTCVVHLLRNSFRYASRRDWAAIARDLRPRWKRWQRSPRRGRPATRPSSGCGSTPGPSSSPSWPSTPRSAPSSPPPTPSRASTRGCAARSTPAATSPTSRPRSSTCT